MAIFVTFDNHQSYINADEIAAVEPMIGNTGKCTIRLKDGKVKTLDMPVVQAMNWMRSGFTLGS